MRRSGNSIGTPFDIMNPMKRTMEPTYKVQRVPMIQAWRIVEYQSGKTLYTGFATRDEAEALANVLRAASSYREKEDVKT